MKESTSKPMKCLRVRWEIDVTADTPDEAAEKALAIQRNPESTATVFDVIDESGAVTTVDLDLTTPYLVFVMDDVDPCLFGPFETRVDRDKKALELRREHGPDHGIFALDIGQSSATTRIHAYSGRFFADLEE